jgi:hypothetical protein
VRTNGEDDQQNEFKMAVGRAIDTLRKDYPEILTSCPDFSIYHEKLVVVDPSGVTLHGVRNYKTSFRFMHALVNFFYCPADSGLTFRLMYDTMRKSIRVSWNAVLVPRKIYGGERNLLHVDGISVYDIDRESGLVTKHHIEHLLLNGEPQMPVEGVFSAIREQAVSDGIPVYTALNPPGSDIGLVPMPAVEGSSNLFTVEFRSGMGTLKNLLSPVTTGSGTGSSTSLFSVSETSNGAAAGAGTDGDFDEAAFNQKNVSRKKFGLPPLSIAEFKELQAQIRKMEAEQQAKAASLAAAATELAERKKSKKNALSSLFGSILEDTCESNFDCERPEICCDFGFKKMCCSSGMKVFDGAMAPGQRMLLRVPASSGSDGEFPQGGPGGMGDGPVSGY